MPNFQWDAASAVDVVHQRFWAYCAITMPLTILTFVEVNSMLRVLALMSGKDLVAENSYEVHCELLSGIDDWLCTR
jgi:hypothetical protein